MTEMSLSTVMEFLEERYPLRLAEEWDNVGLLIGDPEQSVERIMTCLTITPLICREAIEEKADLIISHHPFPFHAIKRLTTETVRGRMIWDIVTEKIAVYSPHTAHDSAPDGINQQIAKRLGLQQITTLYEDKNEKAVSNEGTGRFGMLPEPILFGELLEKTQEAFNQQVIPYIGDPEKSVRTVAVGCGSAGSFLEQAILRGADAFLLGESKYHTFLEAQFNGIGLIVTGHYISERFAMERMAELIQTKFSDLTVWASEVETDPIKYLI
ncbi:MAG: Nif3-like dinuclear metal center hexameric protein [Planctomycetaceae bacterium]|nr:Nif3-like dinuclear metal center hexameric protein [Planctomycetaceae bacterium]